MAREAHLQVTQPYHGPGGVLLFDVGHRFALDAELPDGIRTAPVVEEVPDPEPAPKVPEPKVPATPKGKEAEVPAQ